MILDVLAIATGFVLRAVAGAVAVSVPISQWLLICTMLIVASPALAWRDFTTTWLTQAYTFPARASESIQEIIQAL